MYYTKIFPHHITSHIHFVNHKMNMTCVLTKEKNQLKSGMPGTCAEDFIDPASVGHVSLVAFPIIVIDLHWLIHTLSSNSHFGGDCTCARWQECRVHTIATEQRGEDTTKVCNGYLYLYLFLIAFLIYSIHEILHGGTLISLLGCVMKF